MRRPFLLIGFGYLLYLLGCNASPLELLGGSPGDLDPGGGTDPGILPATVISEDGGYADYSIVATATDKATLQWDFTLKSRLGVNSKLTFEWNIGGVVVAEGLNQAYQFPDLGNYLITVTAREANGRIAFVLSLDLEIVAGNQPPLANAGDDQSVDENQLVFLYGGGSFDADSPSLSYRWAQVSGPPVQLVDFTSATARFVAPLVDADTQAVFSLSVDDGALSTQDTTVVYILDYIDPASLVPVANAGPDLQAVSGELVRLDASGSTGPGSLSYTWTQVSGTPIVLDRPDSAVSYFIAPDVAGATEQFHFEVAVSDGSTSDVDQMMVTVSPPSVSSCDTDTDGDGVFDCDDG